MYDYVTPEVRVLEVEVEEGYAGSEGVGEGLVEDPNKPDTDW